MTEYLTFPVAFKASDEGEGIFEAMVSVYGNKDLQGDIVMEGAFDRTLNEWKSSGDPLPIVWAHDWGNPFAHIGTVKSFDASGEGLKVVGQLDRGDPFAEKVYRLMLDRRVKSFSFGYRPIKHKFKDGARELHDVDIFEVGPTLQGANTRTELLGVKTALEEAALESDIDNAKESVLVELGKVPDPEPDPDPDPEAKAGRRISQATASRLRALRARVEESLGDIDALLEESENQSPEGQSVTASDEPVPDADLLARQHKLQELGGT